MSLRESGIIDFVDKQKLKNDNSNTYPVEIIVATDELLKYWNSYVQPHINNSPYKRADKGWNWPKKKNFYHWASSLLKQSPIFLSVGVTINNQFIPFGMILCAERYPHLLDNSKESTFLWFLSNAPNSFIKTHIGCEFEDLAASLIDCAIVNSYKNLNEGRIGLCSAPKGGKRLYNYYRNNIGLIEIPNYVPLPGIRRILHLVNVVYNVIGPHFSADESLALTLSQNHDKYRP